MRLPFLQSKDIYEKFDALQQRGAGEDSFWMVVTRGVLMLSIALIVYLSIRWVVQRVRERLRTRDRRGKTSWAAGNAEGRTLLAVGSSAAAEFLIGDIPPGTSLAIFWEVGGLHCGGLGIVAGAEDGKLVVECESDDLPTDGAARVVVPESGGGVAFYDATIVETKGDRGRVLECAESLAAAVMDRRFRSAVELKAAALRDSGGEDEEEAAIVRIVDLSLDGLGAISEIDFDPSEEATVRIQFPGYLDPLTIKARVAWKREGVAGLHRVGLATAFDDFQARLLVADYMYQHECADREGSPTRHEPELVEA